MEKIKAVLFDFDGTLMNTNNLILSSWNHCYQSLGLETPSDEYIGASFGEPLSETMAREFPDRDTEDMVNVYRDYQRRIFRGRVEMFDGMADLVRGLRERGYSVGIVTSRLWSSTNRGVYNFDISDTVDVVVSAEDIDEHKPHPESLLKAAAKLGIEPCEAIYVGDSRFDMECAKNAGMKSVLVGWSVSLPEHARTGAHRPDYVIETPAELYALLEA